MSSRAVRCGGLCEGETVLTGAEELRVKESDRIQVMADGLATLGVEIEPRPDGIRIRGGGSGARFGARVNATEVDSSGDHRIAMSFAIAALRASGPSRCGTAPTSTRPSGFRLPGPRRRVSHRRVPPVTAAPVITIDGPSGSGKGTIAALVAQRLGWHTLDSGALYRILGLAANAPGLTWTMPRV